MMHSKKTTTFRRARPIAAALLFAAGAAHAVDTPAALLEARLHADRTGACAVAASIDHGVVTRARYCARTGGDPAPGFEDSFEIGSVTKTMTAFLVADLVDRGQWTLDDPIAAHLPAGTVVPRQGDRQILVRDLLTHRSGLPALPARMHAADPADPYATLTEAALLQSLGDVQLSRPIGSTFEYSNFGMMVLSLAVAHAQGTDLETAMRAKLFDPLHMTGAWIRQPPPGTHVAAGHVPTGAATSPWTVAVDLAGVGMVHASLEDMIRYAKAELDGAPPDVARAMRLTQAPLAPGIGMNWMLEKVDGREFVAHEGATGGFSSMVLLEPASRRAVVILADTAFGDLGGLDGLALAMIGTSVPPGTPRVAVAIPPELRAGMAGRFDLAGLALDIRDVDGHLMAQASGQAAFELFADSHGDLYPTRTTALLTPEPENGRIDHFAWRQGGGVVEARRQLPAAEPSGLAVPVDPRWKDWLGDYAVTPQFGLRVFQDGGRLMVRATGQQAIETQPAGTDRAEIASVGAVLQFERDASGSVVGVKLMQNGAVLDGRRH